jgi:hypothetical protein
MPAEGQLDAEDDKVKVHTWREFLTYLAWIKLLVNLLECSNFRLEISGFVCIGTMQFWVQIVSTFPLYFKCNF